MTTIRSLIDRITRRDGISQNELAREHGLNSAMLARFATGTLKPYRKTTKKLAAVLEVSEAEVYQAACWYDVDKLNAHLNAHPEAAEAVRKIYGGE
jgi:ribosome-binding protein aMBF1 (putative translation factor)